MKSKNNMKKNYWPLYKANFLVHVITTKDGGYKEVPVLFRWAYKYKYHSRGKILREIRIESKILI